MDKPIQLQLEWRKFMNLYFNNDSHAWAYEISRWAMMQHSFFWVKIEAFIHMY